MNNEVIVNIRIKTGPSNKTPKTIIIKQVKCGSSNKKKIYQKINVNCRKNQLRMPKKKARNQYWNERNKSLKKN